MPELSVTDLCKSYGTDVILENIRFNIERGERVGIIGRNGAGKTTLLRIIAGAEEPSSGSVYVAAGSRVGFLRQDSGEHLSAAGAMNSAGFGGNGDNGGTDGTPREELTALDVMQNAYERLKAEGVEVYESEITGIPRGMAFTDRLLNSPVSRLSGGERTRLAFSALLMGKPDILLLDEPTNHLDIGTLGWLEQKLKSWPGTVVLVTHDRYFLDKTVNRIFEVERHGLTAYSGAYSGYAEKKRLIREQELRAYENQRVEIRRQEDMIRHMRERGTEKLAKRAASREKRLAGIVRVERPDSELRAMKIRFGENTRSGNDVLEAIGLSKSFDSGRRELFRGVDFDIKRGERVCLVGANGIGKTTLLRVILGRIPQDAGHISEGVNVRFGYYSQDQIFPDSERTVLEEMTSSYRKYSEPEMRGILARFLFTGDMVFRKISVLSGGERAKLALVKLFLSDSNTLILDEPTNHLDIPSREAVEDALLGYGGTVIVVSHDRYFLNKVPTGIAELTPDGLLFYPGKYDYYMEKRSEAGSGKAYLRSLESRARSGSTGAGSGTRSGSPGAQSGASGARSDLSGTGIGMSDRTEDTTPSLSPAAAEQQRKKSAERERKRREKAIKVVEDRIAELEGQISMTEDKIASPEVRADTARLTELTELLDVLHRALEAKLKEWERVMDA